MNNHQIEKILRKHVGTRNVFIGVFAKDTLPERPVTQRPAGYIVNTDVSDGAGEHWICIYFPSSQPAEYFDSFAADANPRFEQFMDYCYKQNNCILQSPITTVCGQFCILYIYLRHVCGLSMEDIISLLLNRTSDLDHYVNSLIEGIFGEDLDVIDMKFITDRMLSEEDV